MKSIRCFVSLIEVVILIIGLFATPLSVRAEPDTVEPSTVVIDFDDLAAGPRGGSTALKVGLQYQFTGIKFAHRFVIEGYPEPIVLDYSLGTDALPGFTRSGTRAIECSEPCDKPISMSFNPPRAYVKVWVGFSGSYTGEPIERYVKLSVFDAEHHEITPASIVKLPTGSPTPIKTPLELYLDESKIFIAEVQLLDANKMPVSNHGLAIDDIEFRYANAPVTNMRWIVILCKFKDKALPLDSQNKLIDAQYIMDMFSNADQGVDHYWREQSYGEFNVENSDAVGWFTLPEDMMPVNKKDENDTTGYYKYVKIDDAYNINTQKITNHCIAEAQASFNIGDYSGIMFMFNDPVPDYAGFSSVGVEEGIKINGRLIYKPMVWLPLSQDITDLATIVHEMGHSIGLQDSMGKDIPYNNSWDLMGNPRAPLCVPLPDATWSSCIKAYLDTYPSKYGFLPTHTIAWSKYRLGWIPPEERYLAKSGSIETITLERLAQPPITSNPRKLFAQIPINGSSTNFYTVEARKLVGYDAKLNGDAVIIHNVDLLRWYPKGDPKEKLNGFLPEVRDEDRNNITGDDGAMWVAGEAFVDQANGIYVSVESATLTGFEVTISTVADLTPPVSSIHPEGKPGLNGWYTSDVKVTLEAEDNLQGSHVKEIEWSLDGSQTWNIYKDPFTLSQEGMFNLMARASDYYGNVENPPANQIIRIDQTHPHVDIWTDQTEYTRTQPFIVHYSGYDPEPGSGLASLSGTFNGQNVTDGQVIDLFWLSLNNLVLSVTGEDYAGWKTTESASIQIVATMDSLQGTVQRLCQEKYITKSGTCKSLLSKLNSALAAQARGQNKTAANILYAFQNEVRAQTGKSIKPEASAIMIMDSNYLIQRLGRNAR